MNNFHKRACMCVYVCRDVPRFVRVVDILVPIRKFLVVVILSEWWLVPITADHCGHISGVCVYIYGCVSV